MKYLLILTICMITITSKGQNCPPLDNGTKPEANALGYQNRSRGYCEGLVTDERSSGADLDLISYTQGGVHYYAISEEEITISNIFANTVLNIRGLSFNLTRHYRLDFQLAAKETKNISASTVIAKVPVKSENLGLFAFANTGKYPVYYPVSIRSKTIASDQTDQPFEIEILKNITFSNSYYRIATLKNDEPDHFGDPVPIKSSQIQNERILLTIPGNLKGGIYLLRIYYELSNGLTEHRDFRIFIP